MSHIEMRTVAVALCLLCSFLSHFLEVFLSIVSFLISPLGHGRAGGIVSEVE